MKRILMYVIVGIVTFTAVFGAYNRANTVHAVAFVDDIAFISTLLAAFGALTTSFYVNGTSAKEFDDAVEDAYDTHRLTLLQGGGADPDPDDDDKIDDENGDGKIDENDVPTYDMMKKNFIQKGTLKFTASILACLAPAVGKYLKEKDVPSAQTESNIVSLAGQTPEFGSSEYPFFLMYGEPITEVNTAYFLNSNCAIYTNGDTKGFYLVIGGPYVVYSASYGFEFKTGHRYDNYSFDRPGTISFGRIDRVDFHCNLPVFVTRDDALKYIQNKTREIIWTTPELDDTFQNQSGLNHLPNVDPGIMYNPALQEALQALQDQLLNNSDMPDNEKDDLIRNFVNSLQVPDPDYNPNPDPKPDPDPDPKPDPEPDPKPDPEPDPRPDPEPDPKPDPEPDPDVNDYLADLKELFPFCIPFDLIHSFKILAAEPEAPKFDIPINIKAIDFEYTATIDLAKFDEAARVLRILETLGFIVSLIMVTRSLIKG